MRDIQDIHKRWIARLRRTWPEGVPVREAVTLQTGVGRDTEPWPETWHDGICKQCLHCQFYVELSGELGSDWGACTSEASQYDGGLVFEHWTCAHWHPEEDT